MTISNEELVKLAKRGFFLCRSHKTENQQRGYYALCFVFGSEKADLYMTAARGCISDEACPNLEQSFLNSIND